MLTKQKSDKINKIIRSENPYTMQNGTLCFLPGNRTPEYTAGPGIQGKIQNLLKQYGKLYYLLLEIFSPVYPAPWHKRLKELLHIHTEDDVILNLGSGPTHIMGRDDIINMDIFAYHEVDIVADGSDIPFIDKSFDLIINVAFLEHVKKPEMVIRDMYRIIKDRGNIFCFIPFIQPFHAAPQDFQRWTMPGIRELFSDFNHVEIAIAQGPTSGFLWVFQEWFATLLSFGSKTLHDIILLTLMVITAPLKLLDIFMVKFPNAVNIASGFYVIAKK